VAQTFAHFPEDNSRKVPDNFPFKWFNSSRKTDFKIVAHRVLLTFSCSGGNLGYQIFIKKCQLSTESFMQFAFNKVYGLRNSFHYW